MMMKLVSSVFAAGLFVTACVADEDIDPATSSQTQDVKSETRPKHVHAAKGDAGAKAGRTVAISYHGGPVMTGTVNIHYIWYGNWSGNTATTILPALASASPTVVLRAVCAEGPRSAADCDRASRTQASPR